MYTKFDGQVDETVQVELDIQNGILPPWFNETPWRNKKRRYANFEEWSAANNNLEEETE